MKLQDQYKWLLDCTGPKVIVQAIRLLQLDTHEILGRKDNPVIMSMAAEAGLADIYEHDELPWCALAETVIDLRAGKDVPFFGYDRLRAKSFERFGKPVTGFPMFGDTLVFNRPGGYHVGKYIGEDATAYHVAGGNTGNQYGIARIEKSRLYSARRTVFQTGQPKEVRRIFLTADGVISQNEA